MSDQLALFPDVEIVPTPAMQRNASILLCCRHCGTLLCIPSTCAIPDRPRTKRPDAGPCPSCGGKVWALCELGEGPFKPKATA